MAAMTYSEIVITTPQFRAGQAAAQQTAAAACLPNWELIARMPDEFAAGYRYEWTEYVAPLLEVA